MYGQVWEVFARLAQSFSCSIKVGYNSGNYLSHLIHCENVFGLILLMEFSGGAGGIIGRPGILFSAAIFLSFCAACVWSLIRVGCYDLRSENLVDSASCCDLRSEILASGVCCILWHFFIEFRGQILF